MWSTFGHEPIKQILEKQLKAGLFYHAYLFVGPEGVGKKRLALEFAEKILNTRQLAKEPLSPETSSGHSRGTPNSPKANLGNPRSPLKRGEKKGIAMHPDFQLLNTEGEIKMASALEFIARLNWRPFLGKKKVAVINNAQHLNQQSSNALLKSLEEPPDSCVIILISNSRQLLPTILSRCQLFNFSGFSQKQLQSFARQQGLKVGESTLALSFGSPGKLCALAESAEILDRQEKMIGDFKNIKTASVADRLLSIAEYATAEETKLEATILNWCLWQASRLRQEPAGYKALSVLSEAYAGLKKNKNRKLILQNLFLNV